MVTLLLIIAFSSLTFKGLTLSILFTWLNLHPFVTLFLIGEITRDVIKLGSNKIG